MRSKFGAGDGRLSKETLKTGVVAVACVALIAAAPGRGDPVDPLAPPRAALRDHPDGSPPRSAQASLDTVVIRVGHGLVSGQRLRPFAVRWEQRWAGPDGADEHQRFIEEALEIRENPDGDVLWRTQRFLHADGGETFAVNLLNRTDLAPRRWHEVSARGHVTHLDFAGATVSGAFIGEAASPAVLIHREVSEEPFDQRAAALLLAALPLETGMAGRFPFTPLRPPFLNEPEVQWYHFTVEDRETIESPALGEVEAWRVETSQTFTYWVSDDPPYVVQVRFPLRGGHSTFRIVDVRSQGDDG